MSSRVELDRDDYAALCALPGQIRKAWALFVIDTWNSEGNSPAISDPVVKELAEQHSELPIGECEGCGKRAPLRNMTCSTGETSQCAWGCT